MLNEALKYQRRNTMLLLKSLVANFITKEQCDKIRKMRKNHESLAVALALCFRPNAM